MKGLEKELVWEKIKEETDMVFPYKLEVFELIDFHLDRIEFVKDHIGLRDFLFLAETGTHFTSDLFIAINTNVEKEMSVSEKEMAFMEKYKDDPDEVLEELENFFETTDRTLFVGIGFVETSSTEEEEISVLLDLQRGEIETVQEGLKNLRKFPRWYDLIAKMPEEVEFLTKSEEKKLIMKKVDQILDKEKPTEKDRMLFTLLSQQLNSI